MSLKETNSKIEIHWVLPVLILWIFASPVKQKQIKLPHSLNTLLNIMQSTGSSEMCPQLHGTSTNTTQVKQ